LAFQPIITIYRFKIVFSLKASERVSNSSL
jgi:hypothetical protein